MDMVRRFATAQNIPARRPPCQPADNQTDFTPSGCNDGCHSTKLVCCKFFVKIFRYNFVQILEHIKTRDKIPDWIVNSVLSGWLACEYVGSIRGTDWTLSVMAVWWISSGLASHPTSHTPTDRPTDQPTNRPCGTGDCAAGGGQRVEGLGGGWRVAGSGAEHRGGVGVTPSILAPAAVQGGARGGSHSAQLTTTTRSPYQ